MRTVTYIYCPIQDSYKIYKTQSRSQVTNNLIMVTHLLNHVNSKIKTVYEPDTTSKHTTIRVTPLFQY